MTRNGTGAKALPERLALSLPRLSPRFTFAFKSSLAVMLAYLIPLSQGWPQGQTAVICIILIAAAGPIGASVLKGTLRVLGTLLGGIIGMALIAAFPQDRELYLLLTSLAVTAVLYLGRIYRGDPVLFTLTAVMIMMVFNNGGVNDIFLYGINRTYMTVFGIVVYTIIGIYLWPVRDETAHDTLAAELGRKLMQVFRAASASQPERSEAAEAVRDSLERLRQSRYGLGSDSRKALSNRQWRSIVDDYEQIAELLTRRAEEGSEAESFVKNLSEGLGQIGAMIDALAGAWEQGTPLTLPTPWRPQYDKEALASSSHLERAETVAAAQRLSDLHAQLRILGEKINAMLSPMPTRFEYRQRKPFSRFLWGDPDDFRSAFVIFLIFWTTTLLWIWINPPAGFIIVALATLLSPLTVNTPLQPAVMIVLFTFSLLFAAVSYIFVFSHLHSGWQLGAFIFVYAFIGFYFLKSELAIFFLIGLATFDIANEQVFSFSYFLLFLFIFYAFLMVLLFFYYFPFSTRAESMFLRRKARFFTLAARLAKTTNNAASALRHLDPSLEKMKLWLFKINRNYFDTLDSETLTRFAKTCDTLAYRLRILQHLRRKNRYNSLRRRYHETYGASGPAKYLERLNKARRKNEFEAIGRDAEEAMKSERSALEHFLENESAERSGDEELVAFYEETAAVAQVWKSVRTLAETMAGIDFPVLRTARF